MQDSDTTPPFLIYPDHNILISIMDYDTYHNQAIRIAQNLQYKFVFSIAHLQQIAEIPNQDRAIKFARFIDSIHPHWIYHRLVLQKKEACKFIFENFYNEPQPEVIPIQPQLSKMLFESSVDPTQQIEALRKQYQEAYGLPNVRRRLLQTHRDIKRAQHSLITDHPDSAEQYVRNVFKDSNTNTALIHFLSKRRATEAIDHTRNTRPAKYRPDHKIDNEKIFWNYFKKFIPLTTPKGIAIRQKTKENIFNKFKNKKNLILAHNPCFATQYRYFEYSKTQPPASKEKKKDDCNDREHVILALSYCNYFITEDKNLREASRQVSQKLKSTSANAVKSLSDILPSASLLPQAT